MAAITADMTDINLLVVFLFLIITNLLFKNFLLLAICVVSGSCLDFPVGSRERIVLT